jgi:Fe-S cluster assembly protein SufD
MNKPVGNLSAPVAQPEWVTELRAAATQRFLALGLPTARDEAWRFGDLRPLRAAMAADYVGVPGEVGAADIAPVLLKEAAHRFVFVDGVLAPELSRVGALPEGCWLRSWSETILQRPDLAEAGFSASDTLGGRHFASLNAAQFTDGMVLALEPGVTLSAPIELIQVGTGTNLPPAQLRHVVLLGAGSTASIVESALGLGGGCSNSVTTITLGEEATLTHAKLQAEPEAAVHLAETRARLDKGAKLSSFFLVLGARLSRQDVQAAMAGQGAELSLGGCYVLHGDQEATIVPMVDHQVAGCTTQEVFKGVLEEAAHGVFLGSIIVREGADQTEAHQQNHNLLTSPSARIDTRPELEIYADEVKCSHGATVGDLDEAALFYLQARGIDPVSSRQMLIAAFAAEAIERAELPPGIASWLSGHLHARLGGLEDVT